MKGGMPDILTLNDDGTIREEEITTSFLNDEEETASSSFSSNRTNKSVDRLSSQNKQLGGIPLITLESDDEEATHPRNISKLVSSGSLRTEQRVIQDLGNKSIYQLPWREKRIMKRRLKRENAEMIKGKVVMFEQNKIHKTQHDCSPSCLLSNPLPNDKSFSDVSPLYIACTLGWKREISILKNNCTKDIQKFVIYTSPCGKCFFNHRSIQQFLKVTKSTLSIDYFSFETVTNPSKMVKVSEEFSLTSDIARGKELYPVEVVNTIDYEEAPEMEYMTERQFTKSVEHMLEISKHACSGCSCEDDCMNNSKCECQQLTVETMRNFLNKDGGFYGYANRSLSERVLTGVYECNSNCKCFKNRCSNRVVQLPPKYPLQIFRTAFKGWGVRAVTDIPKGAFVTNFVGQIHSQASIHEVPKFTYSADIDYIDTIEKQKKSAWELFVRRKGSQRSDVSSHRDGVDWSSYFEGEEQLFTIDPSVKGNLARFFNHSCSPNIFTQFVFVDTHDIRLPWVSFFTNRNISAGEELSWDYDYDINPSNIKSSFCFCGSTECTGTGVLKF